MDPLTVKMIWFSMGILCLLFSALLIMAAINVKQKAELQIMQCRLDNLRMMKYFDNIGKEKK